MEELITIPFGFDSWIDFLRHIQQDEQMADFVKNSKSESDTIRYEYEVCGDSKRFYISVRMLKCNVFDEIIDKFPTEQEILESKRYILNNAGYKKDGLDPFFVYSFCRKNNI